SGNTNEIRNQYGSNRIEIQYTGEPLRPCGEYSIFSDQESHGRRVALLDIKDEPKKVLAAIADAPIDLISFQKVMPRMADIFINLVTPENQKL
ncbi:MAG: DUF4162 domain-containing protein, partial [Bacteroidales bacterium]|nr:DUF4162 domain-containing protein [Bacteroidales bacterium]